MNTKKSNKSLKLFFLCLLFSPFTIWLNGWALAKLWLWLIVPTFELRPLSTPQAIGLALVAGHLTHQMKLDKDNEKSASEEFFGSLGLDIGKPLVCLATGAIVRLFL